MMLAERMKLYEKQFSADKFVMHGVPVIARLDGRGFSKFTKNMTRPFDKNFTKLMQETAEYLVSKTQAKIAYTQSDEITLVFYKECADSSIFFDGKIQKMCSVLASLGTAYFVSKAITLFPESCKKELPVFDCRVFEVPNTIEASNCILWRMQDAVRNSKNMYGRHFLTHKEMLNKNTIEVISLVYSRGGDWNSLDDSIKYGSIIKRESYFNEEKNCIRTRIVVKNVNFSEMTNDERIGLIFNSEI